jgi:hypothetical protein
MKQEIHKRQGSFRTQFSQVRGAIIRHAIYSFGRMILLFLSEYKGVDGTFYWGENPNLSPNRQRGVSYSSMRRRPSKAVEVTS